MRKQVFLVVLGMVVFGSNVQAINKQLYDRLGIAPDFSFSNLLEFDLLLRLPEVYWQEVFTERCVLLRGLL